MVPARIVVFLTMLLFVPLAVSSALDDHVFLVHEDAPSRSILVLITIIESLVELERESASDRATPVRQDATMLFREFDPSIHRYEVTVAIDELSIIVIGERGSRDVDRILALLRSYDWTDRYEIHGFGFYDWPEWYVAEPEMLDRVSIYDLFENEVVGCSNRPGRRSIVCSITCSDVACRSDDVVEPDAPSDPSEGSPRSGSVPEPPREELYGCDGCALGGSCVPIGSRFEDQGVYCSLNATIEQMRSIGSSCSRDYQCETGLCSLGICGSVEPQRAQESGLLGRIVSFFSRIFGI